MPEIRGQTREKASEMLGKVGLALAEDEEEIVGSVWAPNRIMFQSPDPETVVDWARGGWSGYEDTNGLSGDTGGTDSTLSVRIVEPWEARLWLLRRGR